MNILITGGTGFIGSAVSTRLREENHHITIVTRHPESIKAPMIGISELAQLKNNIDVVINLAGEPIADKRWSEQQKQRIINSRIETTQNLITYLEMTEHKPKLLISGSAIGYYGIGVSDSDVDETLEGDNSFSSQLCQQWETTALQAVNFGIRTCLLRTGIVLGKDGGALSKLLLPFKLGLGGKIGDGKQWMPWIHLDDLVGIILYCIENNNLNGAVNGTSPNPVTNLEFTKTLGKVLKRPTLLPMPSLAIKFLMGQMGEEILLAGKKVVPAKALDAGYQFKYKKLEGALLDIV